MASDLNLGVKIAVSETGSEKLDELNQSLDQTGKVSTNAGQSVVYFNNVLGAIEQVSGYVSEISNAVREIAKLGMPTKPIMSESAKPQGCSPRLRGWTGNDIISMVSTLRRGS